MRLSESDRITKSPLEEKFDPMAKPSSYGAEERSQTEAPDFPPNDNAEIADSLSLGFVPVLRNREFLTLWSGQVFSQLADKIYLVLMIAIIASRFQDANQSISGWVSALMVAFTIPAVLFGSVAGVFVDRWPKKTVLVATNLLRGFLVLGVPVLLWVTHGWKPLYNLPVGFYILLGITFLVSTLTQFFAPAEQAVIPLIVKPRNLLSANSLYTTTMMASLIVGFAVGDPLLALTDTLVHRLGFGWDFGKELVVGGSYAIAGLLLVLLNTGESQEAPTGETPHVFADIWDGLRYVKHHRRIRNALIQLVILFSIFAALSVLAVRLAETLPGMKTSQFGFLLAAGGVGLACGAAVLGHWGQHLSHARLGLYGSIGMAGSLAGLSVFSHHLWLALLMTTLLGAFGALVGIPMQTTIQAETPQEMRGKVFGLQNNVVNIALSLPLALAGFAETILGLQTVLFSLAALAIAGGVLNWYISRT
ncbi:MAG TPA: MFS transporter [Chroococcales cyanobacterium]|jgi:MFS family permease